ncbi:MAG: hypothetical protein FWG30_03670, partial [Eubacteriaceae bacterium]|nr:hypothetical protein [Eubacteriaceae bacterium]
KCFEKDGSNVAISLTQDDAEKLFGSLQLNGWEQNGDLKGPSETFQSLPHTSLEIKGNQSTDFWMEIDYDLKTARVFRLLAVNAKEYDYEWVDYSVSDEVIKNLKNFEKRLPEPVFPQVTALEPIVDFPKPKIMSFDDLQAIGEQLLLFREAARAGVITPTMAEAGVKSSVIELTNQEAQRLLHFLKLNEWKEESDIVGPEDSFTPLNELADFEINTHPFYGNYRLSDFTFHIDYKTGSAVVRRLICNDDNSISHEWKSYSIPDQVIESLKSFAKSLLKAHLKDRYIWVADKAVWLERDFE